MGELCDRIEMGWTCCIACCEVNTGNKRSLVQQKTETRDYFQNRYDIPVPGCFKEFSDTYYHICNNIYGIKSFILNNPILYVFLCVK